MASNLVNLVATGLAMADVSQASRWREEDLIQRKLENTRRDIDEKTEQLRSISSLAALVAGFDVVVLIELDIPAGVPEPLLIFLGITSALTVVLMSLSFVLCTLMLVGILKAFDINSSRRQTFRDFWILRCEDDWRRAFGYFTAGVPFFMSNLAFASWVKFFNYRWTSSLITIVVAIGIFVWYQLHQKWGSFLAEKSVMQVAKLDSSPSNSNDHMSILESALEAGHRDDGANSYNNPGKCSQPTTEVQEAESKNNSENHVLSNV
mmetsp:Transcript_7645/g.8780  ORF Transcript_7645/g.8780 Transcript_7645/m.8780 type:complete len:264 (-) Transcript_7645:1606-2397(-)|eukprot:CAMPEP_0184012278 /NCGR_PEP_ID=MMETSP0954-20121128/4311_1 /TAXON_ID=627963 /ORGANISM="Aplanochytrium sp, Strain PBS07" /LENGTH=263 /DNA_ID=CAMNT_0026292223 /DNA_START=1544 /DNA_END=2335 /DNA_ORIENTATION=+